MAKKFAALITEKGKTLIAAAIAGGDTLKLKYLAVGDGNGATVTPTSDQTALVNEVARVEINSLKETDATKQTIAAEAIIPAATGGFWMREAGLFLEDGTLIAVSQLPETYKPDTDDGATSTQTMRMLLNVSDTSVVNLTVDDSTVIATEDYVNSQLTAHEKSRNHPDGTLKAKGFVQLSNATDSSSEMLAATPKAVSAVNENAETRLKISENLSDVDDAATSLANIGGVPTTRKINSKALSADITLSAGDVGAVQQGGGTGMLTNKVYLGWTGSKLKLQVDTTDEGEIYTTYNCPFPVGFVMLMGNQADPNAYFPGTTWVNQSGSFGGRVLAIGTAPGTVGGANSATLSADNLPGHSHQGGVSAPGAAYAQFKTGTDNTGTYNLNYTNGTFTDNTNGVSVTNAPFSVQNEFVHFCCWLRTA